MKLDNPLIARFGVLLPRAKSQSLVGYIYEAGHLSGWPRMKDMANELVARQTIQPPWTVPTNLRLICENLAPVFESAEQILEQHTCLPAHLPFISLEQRQLLLRHVFDGHMQKGVASMIGLASRDIVSKPEMALCPKCLSEDQSRGRAIWRREHQLAGLGYCPTHGCPLLVGCGSCSLSQRSTRNARMPTLHCACGQERRLSHPSLNDEDGEVIARMARYASRLLEGEMREWNAVDVTGYFHLAARQRGFACGSRFKTVDICNELRKRYPRTVLKRLNAAMDGDRNWLPKVFGREGVSCVLGRNLLLLDFFDGRLPTQADLEDSRRHMQTWRPSRMGGPRSQPESQPLPDDRLRIEAHIATHPGTTRSALLKALGRVVTRVRAHDGEWYETVLASAKKGKQKETEVERASYLAYLDERTAAHVRRRQLELLAHGGRHPHPITRAALLKECPRGNEITSELLKVLPKTTAALSAAICDPLENKRRLAVAILRRSRGDPFTIQRAHARTGLKLTEIQELNAVVLAEEVDAAGKKMSGDAR